MERLAGAAIKDGLARLPGWRPGDDGASIARDWSTADFAAAFALVGRIASLAEAADHHPEISFGYGHLRVTLSTHDAGGVTGRDLALARRIDDALGS